MYINELHNDLKQGFKSSEIHATDRNQEAQAAKVASQYEARALKPAEKADEGNAREKNLTREEARTIAKELEKRLESGDVQLKFNLIEEAETIQVEVRDDEGKVIRKIPEDDIIKLRKSLRNGGANILDETF